MTAPGQEPDEVLTAKPAGEGHDTDEPDLKKIGDHHLPEDLRESAREKGEERSDETEPPRD
jgi:hypothetical protein